MTNEELIAKIKAEIERRKDICSGVFERNSDTYYQGKAVAYDETLSFLSTLESEKPSDGLEEEIDRLWESFADEMEGPHNLFDIYARLARHFAEWQKEQIIKNAVEGEVYKFGEVAYVKERSNAELTKYLSQFNNGDKVKIIVIHETDIR